MPRSYSSLSPKFPDDILGVMILNTYILFTLACLFSAAESRASRRHNGTDFILKFFQTDPFLESLQKNSYPPSFQVNSSLESLQMNYFWGSYRMDSFLESLQMNCSLESLDESYPALTTTTSSFLCAQCNALTVFKQIHHDLYSFYLSLTLAALIYLIHTRARFVRAKRLLKPPHFKAESPTIHHDLYFFCFILTTAPIYLIHTRARFVRIKRLLKPSHFKAESPTIQPFQPLIYALWFLSWCPMMPFTGIFGHILSFLGSGIVFSIRPLLPRNVASLHVQTAPFKLGNPPRFILPALLTHHISYSPLRQ